MTDKLKRIEQFARLKDSIAQDLLTQTDAEILAGAAEEGINPEASRSRMLEALQEAKEQSSRKHKPVVLNIDAKRARALLQRAARRPPIEIPASLREAAELAPEKSDTQVVELVRELKESGVISDDELKK